MYSSFRLYGEYYRLREFAPAGSSNLALAVKPKIIHNYTSFAHLFSSMGASSFSLEACVLGKLTLFRPHFPDCCVILPLTSGTTCLSSTSGTRGTRGRGEYVGVNGVGRGVVAGCRYVGREEYAGRGG